jgi:2-polyprenyl-3-methyl-5-hydroxy-6-metoxy-1,4-benzoquinol methylase
MKEANKKYLSVGIDLNGRVFEKEGEIYREIYKETKWLYEELLHNENLMIFLNESGLVKTKRVISKGESEMILKHEKIDPISFYLEWSLDMLKEAALLTIQITKDLNKHGYDLKDAHPFNILFDHTKPVFVDFTSIIKKTSDFNVSWKNSFFIEFVVPLFLVSKGWEKLNKKYFYWEDNPEQRAKYGRQLIKFASTYNGIFNSSSRNDSLNKLEDYVNNFKLNNYTTRWEDYYSRDKIKDINDKSTLTNKENSTIKFLKLLKNKGQETLLDIAANEGWFSIVAESMGYKVVAFDYDERAINNLYNKIKNTGKRILPIVMDFTKLTRVFGIQNNWPSATIRYKCDVTLSMAIIHHLSLGQNVRFEEFAKKLELLTKNYAIVEFIGVDDEHIQNWLKGKDWYNETNFMNAMNKHFTLDHTSISEPKTRKVFLFSKK